MSVTELSRDSAIIPTQTVQPLLDVSGITKLYQPGKGCQDISFDLWPGEVLGIVGESGSGKVPCCVCFPGGKHRIQAR